MAKIEDGLNYITRYQKKLKKVQIILIQIMNNILLII